MEQIGRGRQMENKNRARQSKTDEKQKQSWQVKPQQAEEPWIEIIAKVQIANWSQERRQSWVKLW